MGGKSDIILRLKTWQLVVFTVLFAEIFTAISNIVLSLVWYKGISLDLLQIGSLDALFVAVVVAPLMIYAARHSTRLQIEKEVLEKEVMERRRAEESLLLLEKAVNTTQTGITLCDVKYTIWFTNPADAAMHGYSPEELVGSDVRIFAPPGLRKDMSIQQIKAMKSWTRESLNIRKDCTVFPVRLTSDVVMNEKGEPVGIVTTCEDITERKEAEEELEELIRQKDMFITRLGHDLKTPLTPLSTLLPLVREQADDPKLKRLLDVTIQNVNTMKELVIKTLKLARASSASADRKLETVALKKEVDEYIAKRKYIIERGGLEVFNNIAPDVTVLTDRFDLEEVFYNLISNAVKYSRERGTIIIDASADGGFVKVSVKDAGIGLTGEQIKRIFDEFYKVDESRHELDSSGLGLSICRKIVERNGGKIWAESPGKGLGTTVFLTIRKGGEKEGGHG